MSADVRTTLQQVNEAVPVPAYDAEGVRTRTRRLRRRRRGTRAAAGAVLAAAVVGGVVVPRLDGGDGAGGAGDPTAVDRQAAGSPGTGPANPTVPVVLDGQLSSVGLDGSVSDLGDLAGSIVGRLDGRLVVLDGTRLRGAGGSDVDGVVAAYADPTGVTYQLADGTVGRRGAGGVDAGGAGVAGGRLVAGGERGFVTERGGAPTVWATDGRYVLHTSSDGARARADAVEVGGDTVVVTGEDVVDLYRLDGTRRGGFLGGTTGALSPDGATYAYAPSADERAQGMRPGLTRYDVASEETTRTALPAAAVDLAWYGDDLWVVTGDAGSRTLWSCGTTCETVLDDPTGTLRLR